MKKMTLAILIAVTTTQVFSAAFRDSTLKGTSVASETIIEHGESTFDQTLTSADLVAEQLNALISKNMVSSFEATGKLGQAIVDLSQFSKPVFRFTADGLAMVFEATKSSGGETLEASKKLIVLLDPTLQFSKEILYDIFKGMSKGTGYSSDISRLLIELLEEPVNLSTSTFRKIYEILQTPIDFSTMTGRELGQLISKVTKGTSDLTNSIVGKQNIDAGANLSSEGVSLTSKGIGAALYFVTEAITGITGIFQFNREEIQNAVDRNDQDILDSLKEQIRAEINKSVEQGEELNQLISDADLDFYIVALLATDAL